MGNKFYGLLPSDTPEQVRNSNKFILFISIILLLAVITGVIIKSRSVVLYGKIVNFKEYPKRDDIVDFKDFMKLGLVIRVNEDTEEEQTFETVEYKESYGDRLRIGDIVKVKMEKTGITSTPYIEGVYPIFDRKELPEKYQNSETKTASRDNIYKAGVSLDEFKKIYNAAQ